MLSPFVIGIGGGTGSGKTYVTDMLCRKCADTGVAVLNQDSYYLDRSGRSEEERRSLNYYHPSAIDHDLLLHHLGQLLSGSAVGRPCYCFTTHSRRSEVELVNPAPVILVEGIFALWDPRLRARMDLKIYVDADPGLRFIRRLRKDVGERGRTLHSVFRQYQDSVRPMHEAFIQPTRAYADFVIDNSGSLENLATLLKGLTTEIQPGGTADDETPGDLARLSPAEHYERKLHVLATQGTVLAEESCKVRN